jgi:NAD(P)-dependent dehydrogenase (short-subunit alcohol dehydrogenase family)
MTRRFEDQVVWITGGGSGIGRALAIEFAKLGAIVAVSGRRREKLDEVVRAIRMEKARGLAVPCDVTDETSVRDAADEVVRTLGRMDVVIANAGYAVSGRIAKLTAEDWRRQLDTNVIGCAMTAKYSLPALEKTGGRLALIGSVAGVIPTPGVGAYSASKAAVRSMGMTLAIELAGSGVSCTTVMPGYVESEIAQVDNAGNHDATRIDDRPKQLLWKADKAARVIIDAIERREREFVFTAHGKVGVFIGQHAPGLVPLVLEKAGLVQQRRRRR